MGRHPLIIVATSLLLLPLVTGTNGVEKVEIFLADLVNFQFPHCALFFFRGGDNDDVLGDRLVAGVMQKVGVVAYYSAVYDKKKSVVKFGMEDVTMFNRRGSVCKVAVGTILDKVGLERVKNSISPVYLPIVSKHMDRWVWVTSKPSQLEPLLLSPSLPAKIKYKLGLSPSSSSSRELVMQSVCFFCDEGSPQIVNFPHRHPSTFNYFPDYVLNLKGRLLRVVFPAVTSRVYAAPPYEGVNNAKRGLWKPLFEEFLMSKLNFTYNMFLATGKGTGLELPNGTWIGTVGDIVSDRADIGIITASTPKRIKVVSFTNSFFDISFLNFITAEGDRVFSPLALLWPFDLIMWGLIGISTLAAFVFFKIITLSMSALGMDKGDDVGFARRGVVSHENWGLQHQIFFVMTSYLDQDCVLPTFTPLRCFVALWLFFVLIITTVYRSKMVGLLAFPILEEIPETFEQLVGSKFQVGFSKHGDAAYNTLKASTDPVYVKLVKEMQIINGHGLECLERVLTKKYACIIYSVAATYLVARNLSDADIRKLVYAPETTYNIFMGLIFQGGSIYKDSFDRWLRWTRPFHLAYLWEEHDMYYNVRLAKRAWWEETNQTDKLAHYVNTESDDLTMLHISGAFYSFVACLVLSCCVFVQEVIYFRKHEKAAKARARVMHRVLVKLKMVAVTSKMGKEDDNMTGYYFR